MEASSPESLPKPTDGYFWKMVQVLSVNKKSKFADFSHFLPWNAASAVWLGKTFPALFLKHNITHQFLLFLQTAK